MESASQVVYTTFHMILLLFFLGAVMALYMFTIGYTSTQYVPEEFTYTMHLLRFKHTCFAYTDPMSMRTYSQVIDASLFTQERLQSCYLVDPKTQSPAYRLRLKTDTFDSTISTSNFAAGGSRLAYPIVVQEGEKRVRGTLFVDARGAK